MRASKVVATVASHFRIHRSTLKRTHHLGEIERSDVGKEIVLTAWLAGYRSRKDGRAFLQLKDARGSLQVVVQELPPHVPQPEGFDYRELSSRLASIRPESVITVRGNLALRDNATARATRQNGEYELFLRDFETLNEPSAVLPFNPSSAHNDAKLPNQNVLFEHRYLDLRRDAVGKNIRMRSKVMQTIRQSLLDEDFMEVETPILLRSSPEGAREFLVPTRVTQSSLPSDTLDPSSSSSPTSSKPANSSETRFYALAQSPQQPKQLLICSGSVEKYFQFARCFRDEDGRKDRQPEFTQVDMEKAFVSWEPDSASKQRGWRIGGMEVRDSVETLVKKTWKEALDVELPKHFPVMAYQDAMARYGSDKPDTRFGYEIQPLQSFCEVPSEHFKADHFVDCLVIPAKDQAMQQALRELGLIKAPPPGVECRKVRTNHQLKGDIRALQDTAAGAHIDQLRIQAEAGDVIFFASRKGPFEGGSTSLGDLRRQLIQRAEQNGLLAPETYKFLWITEFPLFTRADSDKDFLAKGRWSSSHHPFTAPMWDDLEKLEKGDFASVRAQHYDLVLNGMEVGGGSVRIHDASLQEFVFKQVLQLSEQEAEPFDTLLKALKSGAPPHGGIALGFDRLMTIICGVSSIKDVIAFPKTLGGLDPLFKSPSSVSGDALAPYGLKSSFDRR